MAGQVVGQRIVTSIKTAWQMIRRFRLAQLAGVGRRLPAPGPEAPSVPPASPSPLEPPSLQALAPRPCSQRTRRKPSEQWGDDTLIVRFVRRHSRHCAAGFRSVRLQGVSSRTFSARPLQRSPPNHNRPSRDAATARCSPTAAVFQGRLKTHTHPFLHGTGSTYSSDR